MYIEISEDGDLKKLCRKGFADPIKCSEIWEEIVKRCAAAQGNLEFDNYLEAYQNYSIVLSEYLFIRACLLKFWFKGLRKSDLPFVEKLKNKGFKIDLTEREKYKESLIKATKQVRAMITKILNKKSELDEFNKKENTKRSTFDSIIAALMYQWPGTGISDGITLARYNECIRLLREREVSKRQKEWQTI